MYEKSNRYLAVSLGTFRIGTNRLCLTDSVMIEHRPVVKLYVCVSTYDYISVDAEEPNFL